MTHKRGCLLALATVSLAAAAQAELRAPCPPTPLLASALTGDTDPSPTWLAALDEPAAFCFAPDTDPEVIARFRAAMDGVSPRSNPIDRWQNTAHGPAGPEGTPIILTYSFVPDGASVPPSTWSTGGPSSLNAFFTGIYGSEAAWQAVFHQAFQRWSSLTGITFIHEPNDDGVNLASSNRGILGVRGDIRISAVRIDGSGSILAYNSYPDHGDMVIDADDSWFSNPSGDSRGLQNLIMHEVGHGIGLAHVCPVQNTKIMEPFITAGFYGPQHDDLRGVHSLYGDIAEPDNAPAQAVDLGELPHGPMLVGAPPGQSINHGSTRSIIHPGDEDWLRFTVDAPTSLLLTLTPLGTSYYEGDQACPDNVGDCCRGVVINSRTMSDISMQVLDAAGATVLASADGAQPGFAEHIPEVILDPGAYTVRITGTGAVDEAQLYTLTLSREDYVTPVCPCEMDGDAAAVDVFDLLAYLDLWFPQDAAAERTGDDPASIDVFDLLSFLDCWFPASAGAACP